MHDLEHNKPSIDSAGSLEYGTSFEQLRKWYLARLHKQALEQKENRLTPAALINADKILIEGLILSAVTADKKTTDSNNLYSRQFVLISCLVVLGALFISILALLSGNLKESLTMFLNLTVGAPLLQGDILRSYEKVGRLAFAVPLVAFAFPAIVPALFELLAAGKSAGRELVLRFIFLCVVVLLPMVSLAVITCTTASAGSLSANLPSLRMLLAAFSWTCMFVNLYFREIRLTYAEPLAALNNRLHTSAQNHPDRGAMASAPPAGQAGSKFVRVRDLVAEIDDIVRQRDELISREHLTVDAAPLLLLVLDEEGRITAINGSTERATGYSDSELLCKPFGQFLLSEQCAEIEKIFELCKLSKQLQTYDCRMLRKQQDLLDIRWEFEYSQTQRCLFASGQDISAEKALERTKSEFISVLGHDIKSPLAAALITVQSLSRGTYGAISSLAETRITNVLTCLNKILNLLNELLEFEQLSAGRLTLHLESLDIAELVELALELVSSELELRSLKLECQLDHVRISADAERLKRVITHILSYAIDSSPQGATIYVTVTESSKSMELRINDQGPGIPPELQKTIFERYERRTSDAKSSRQSASGGAAVGLAIARAIIQAHGGLIGVDSVPGGGASFWFTLPLR